MKKSSRSLDICAIMDADSCEDCGKDYYNYFVWQPCNENIPVHIPYEQIKRWLMVRRDNAFKEIEGPG